MSTTERYLRTLSKKYGLTPDEYRALYYAQGGRCYGCRVAAGEARRLGVDHSHLTGEVRALVCSGSYNANTCNRLVAIHRRDAFLRLAEILSDPPPARALLTAMRAGETVLPMLAGEGTFDLSEVRGVTLH